MANIVISEEGYPFNYEWIAAGSGIGEEICGVDKDCIVVPTSPLLPKLEPLENHEENNEYVEIQVTEEEVVTDQWSSQNHGSEDDGLSFRVDTSHEEDVMVPLSEEQDEYSRLHPYPCDFCSRRFSKKSALTTHMISHQSERSHGCNMCGAQYRRKFDLVEHMKIHAYAPVKEEPEDDYVEYPTLPQAKAKQRARRKKKNLRKYEFNDSVVKEKKTKVPIYEDTFVGIKVEPTSPEPVHLPEDEPKFPICDPNKPYVCQHCGVGFAREKALTSHTMVHIGDSAFDCDICGEMFQSEKLLEQHNILRHANDRYHHRSVTVKKEEDSYGSFLCNECGLSFQWYNQLKKHRKTHIKQETIPVDEDGHLCTLCNIVFNTLEELLYHKQDHDSEIGVHTCYLCGEEAYESLVDLKDHMRMKHKSTHMCEMCDKMFKDGKALSKHLSSHIEVRTFPCTVCSRRFHSKAKLKKHMMMHDENKSSASGMLCPDCGEVFNDGQTLLNHRQSVHGTNISRMFPCLQCGKAFNSRSSHQIHLRIHTGERPYGCRYCWKAFGDGGTLRKHERIHTGEKPYVCPVCSKAFNQRVVLREHIRAHHSGIESRLSDNCYECMVCGFMLKTSSELCAHLVLHSDENTAKHRTPKSNRKYIRKKSRFGGGMGGGGMDDEDESIEEEGRLPEPQPPPPPPPQQHVVRFSEDLETAIKIDPDLNTSTLDLKGRARIVRSGRKGVPRGQNKRYMRGKTKASRLMNNTSYASKYIVSRPEESDPLATSPEQSPARSMVNGGGGQRSRPRTKNVSYHNTKPISYELATFPLGAGEPSHPSTRGGRSSSPRKRGRRETEPLAASASPPENQYVNGIDLFDDTTGGEQIETCIVDDIDVELKLEVKTSESEECYISPEDMPIKMEYVSCDMCSQVFTNRSDLLKHIQIHI